MTRIDRRRLLGMAAALGASAAWSTGRAAPSRRSWRERRDLYAEGVASGDPQESSVILWTRRPPQAGERAPALTVEVAEDEAFARVIAAAPARVSAASGWTTRVLVGGLKPRTVYWYRFTDAAGNGSRVGRTVTAPRPGDDATVRFAFVSCQNANQGAMNAYRRMIWEDERKPEHERLDFVCHLGDFIYELVWYPEDRPKGYYDRRLRDVVRYAGGEKISDFHIPTTLDDYRAVYCGYLHDPDLQDARARFPFVAMWDNHEFSWRGYQGVQKFGDDVVWAQDRKVFANQAWFEFQPARVKHAGTLETFAAPKVTNGPIGPVDDHGLGQAPSNLAAINSLIGYRSLRFGKHMELILTDHHSYKMDEPTDRPEAQAFDVQGFPLVAPEEINDILDAGRAFPGGAPATIPFGGNQAANYRKDEPPFTALGATQKAWLKRTLKASGATWKVWGCTNGALDLRADPQNLPAGLGPPWPGAGYGNGGGGDFSGAVTERAELYDFVRDQQITGFSIVSGDRHSFWAGLAAKALPPKAFEPVGVAFITGSISAPGFVESAEYGLKKDGPLRALYLRDVPGQKPEPTVNMLLKHGVRSCLEYARTGDVVAARKLSNPELSPHLSFVDMSGHGYAAVTVSGSAMETEFVAIHRPLERSATPDGGPLAYRVTHRAPLWRKGEKPRLEQKVLEGDPKLSI